MKLIALASDVLASEPVVMMNADDCLELGVGPDDRVRISGERATVSTVTVTDRLVRKGALGMPACVLERCGAKDGGIVDVTYCPMPGSIRSLRRKIDGGKLDRDEMDSIVADVMAGNLSDKEILAFVSAFNVNNSDLEEVAYLTRAMAATGTTVDLGRRPVFDFHSLGGIPGNKITPIVVSIAASEGLIIPKLSSRAVSSACGTADFVDTFCDVEMDPESLKEAVLRTGGVFACGNDDYAPVGKRIIKAERPLGIDPRPTMMASIMSKKVALGTTHLLVDIPFGPGSKVRDIGAARSFARNLIDLGTILGMHVECAASRADQPLGTAIGPILEARECIRALKEGDADPSVVDKACGMAGIILEMAGEKDGRRRAEEVFRSGRAYEKFMEIAAAQNGTPDLSLPELEPGAFRKDVHAKRDGFVQMVDNPCIAAIAKGAGAPADLGAGIVLLHKKGDRVSEGEALFTIYAENQTKLDRAVESARSRRPMLVSEDPVESPGGIVAERIPSKEMLDLIRFRPSRRSQR